MITKLIAQNFMSFSDLILDLPQTGILQIDGRVEESGFDNNGAGKTAVVNLIRWVLYGDFDRGLADDVVNTTAKKNCAGVVYLTTPRGKVEVLRARKHHTWKNNAFLTINDKPVTATDAADMQRRIDAAVGMDKDTFRRTALFDKSISLAALSDGDAKELFEKLIGHDFTSWHVIAKEHTKDVKLRIETVYSNVTTHQNNIALHQSHLQELKRAAQDAKALADAAIAEIRTRIETQQEIIFTEEPMRDGHQIHLDVATETRDQAQERHDSVEQHNAFVPVAERNLRMLEGQRMVEQQTVDSPEPKVHSTCVTCGQTINNIDAVHLHTATVDAAREAIKSLDRQITQHQELLQGKLDPAATLKVVMDAQELVHHHEKAVGECDQSIRLARTSIEADTALADTYDAQCHDAGVQDTQDRITREQTSLADVNELVPALRHELQCAEHTVTMFGKEGLRSFTLDYLLPYLNTRLAYYLSVVTGGKILAEFRTTSDTGRERFHVHVQRLQGGTGYKSLSEGERTRLNLCLILAVLDRIRSDYPTPLVVFDELFDALDPTGAERVINLLREVSQTALVIIISHSQHVRSHVDRVITLVKGSDGLTTLETDDV